MGQIIDFQAPFTIFDKKPIFFFHLLIHKIKKELIINIYMLIKSVIKAGRERLIVVILLLNRKEDICYM